MKVRSHKGWCLEVDNPVYARDGQRFAWVVSPDHRVRGFGRGSSAPAAVADAHRDYLTCPESGRSTSDDNAVSAVVKGGA